MESSSGTVIVRVVLPLVELALAVMVVLPTAAVVARPVLRPIVAFAGLLLVQLAVVVKLAVEPSEYVPLALNCCVLPSAIDGSGGVITITSSTLGPTVRIVLSLMPLSVSVAVMVVFPVAWLVVNPPAVMVATVVLELVQVTAAVMSGVELSE